MTTRGAAKPRGGLPEQSGAGAELVNSATALDAAPEGSAAGEDNFRAFFEALDDMVFVGNQNGQILFSNRAASRKLGYTPGELRTMLLIDLHPAEMRQKAAEIVGAMLRGERDTCPLPLEQKSGRHLLVETRVWPGKWDGKDCLFGLCKDMTELKEAKQDREELLDRILKIAGRVPGLIYQYRLRPDGSSCFPFASEAIKEIYRVTPEEVLEDASKVFANLHPDDYDGIVESIQKSARDLTPWQHEYRVKFADGTIRALYGNAMPQKEADGSVLWHGFITDITGRKQAEEELRQLAERLAMATKAGGVGIWDWDVANDRLVWDDNMYRQYGITRDQFAGAYEAWTAGLHPDDRERGDAEIQMALRGEKDFNTDFRVLWPDGSTHHIRAMALVQRNAAGEPLHMVGTNWDITELKRAESTVLQNLARAEELTLLKSRFVSMASHELRTPLANIMLSCELLKNFGPAMSLERSQSVLSGLVDGVTSMVRTLDDLLLAGKLEEGKLPNTPARFPLLDFLKRCCHEVQLDLKLPSRIEIGFRDAGLSVTADERLLHHVLKNLLENALKYSPPDTVVELGVEAGPDSLTLSVRDRGIGVPEAERQFLFDAFSRASNVGDRPGSGLGLFIAQKCVQAHGGQLRYAPQPGGSFFSVTIPLATVA
ncbi:MAG: PAS domain-containing protein [Verrucomicrobiota bacterium]